jgi:flagellar operon protein
MKSVHLGPVYPLNSHKLSKPIQRPIQRVEQNAVSKPSFSYHLQQTVATHKGVKFSQHAVARMRERGIEVTPELVEKISFGVNKAQAKGSKESLFLIDDQAFVISVKNQTVITAMEREDMQDQMITNIDSAVLL